MERNSFELQISGMLDLMGAVLPGMEHIDRPEITPELKAAYCRLAEREGAKTIKELARALAAKKGGE